MAARKAAWAALSHCRRQPAARNVLHRAGIGGNKLLARGSAAAQRVKWRMSYYARLVRMNVDARPVKMARKCALSAIRVAANIKSW